jgi:arylsulfatase A-like enzyme
MNAIAIAALAGALAGLAEAAGFALAQRQYLASFAECLAVLGTPPALGIAVGALGGLAVRRFLAPAPALALLPFCMAVAAVLRWRRTDFAGSGGWIATTAVAGLSTLLLLVTARRMRASGAARLLAALLLYVATWASGTALSLAASTETSLLKEAPPIPGAAAGARAAFAPDHLVLVTWDTVRADSLPLFGGEGLDTPHLDELARGVFRFERALAVAPITGPAHLSLLTGLYPPQHGLRSNGDPAPPARGPHLAELLRGAGYTTAGFVSNLALMRRSGFDRGFDTFDDRPSAPPSARFLSLARLGSIFLQRVLPAELTAVAHQTPGEVTLARAQSWIERTRGPSFLWTHFYDAHAPYAPPEPFRSRTRARAAEGARAADPAAQEDWIAQRGEIELLDDLLGRLVASLERRDPGLRSTLVVVVADHGECFGEGGLRGHHQSLLHATQHVPLVVRPAGAPRAGLAVDVPVSQVDLLPTLLGFVGLPPPPECAGIDLFELLEHGDPDAAAERGFYFEAFQRALGPRRQQGWQQGSLKYLRDLAGGERLLRIGEQGEEPSDDPELLAWMREQLDRWLAANPALDGNAAEQGQSRFDAEALQALGYGDR